MKTKMNFSDITNVIERDEMKKIMGGEYAIPTTIIPPESYDDPMRIPRDELTPSGFVFGTPGKISAPLPGYRTPTYQGGELNTVVIGPRNNSSSSNPYGSFQLGGGYNSSYSIGYSNGYGGGGDSTSKTFNAIAFGWDMKTMLTGVAVAENATEIGTKYLKYLEGVGVAGLAFGAYLTLSDAYDKGGLSDYHIADLGTQALIFGAATAVPVAGWTLGTAYFLANYYCEKTYGVGLYEHLNNNK